MVDVVFPRRRIVGYARTDIYTGMGVDDASSGFTVNLKMIVTLGTYTECAGPGSNTAASAREGFGIKRYRV